MGGSCKGVCDNHPEMPFSNKGSVTQEYLNKNKDVPIKSCTVCSKRIRTDAQRCPCCSYKLRIRIGHSSSKRLK